MFHAFIIDDDVISAEATYKLFPWKELNITKIDKIYIPDDVSTRILKEQPDVVFIDIEMGNVSGIDIIKECKKQGCESSFVVVSGHSNFEYAHAAINLGAVYYMLKPINPKDITELVLKLKNGLSKKEQFSSYLSSSKSFENYLKQILDNQSYRFLISSLSGEVLKDFCVLIDGIDFQYYEIGAQKYLFIIENNIVSPHFLADLEKFAISNKVVISISKIFNKNENIYEHFKQTNQLSYQHFLNSSRGFLIDASVHADTQILKEVYKELSAAIDSKYFEKIEKLFKNLSSLFKSQKYTMSHVMWFYNALVGKINIAYHPDGMFPFSQMDEEELTINFQSFDNLCDELFSALKELISPDLLQDAYQSKLWKEISKYIEENYTKRIQVSDICDQFYISTKTLYNISVANTNKSYLEYLTSFRMERAKNLLKSTPLSIPEIAENIGIKDHYYFNRIFKKHTGLTPSEFRNKKGNFDNVK